MSAQAHIRLVIQGAEAGLPVQSIRLIRELAHPVGLVDLILPLGVQSPETGAKISLFAVSEGQDLKLFSGVVTRASACRLGTRLWILEPASALSSYAPTASYASATAGKIIKDLCRQASVQTGTVLPGITVPHMVLDSRVTLLDHCQRLARLSGLALVTNTQGILSMLALGVPIPGAIINTGRGAIETRDLADNDTAQDIRIIGGGAFGSKGPGNTSLPLSDVSLMQSGSQTADITFAAAGIKVLSDGLMLKLVEGQRLAAARSGLELTTPLFEDLTPGDVVTLPNASGVPVRLARVESVSATLSPANGLTARYRFSDLKVA